MGGRDEAERVHLHRVGHECRARWRHGDGDTWSTLYVQVGVFDDGRWYVQASAGGPARVYASRELAWVVVRNWLRTRDARGWVRIPCYPGQAGGGTETIGR